LFATINNILHDDLDSSANDKKNERARISRDFVVAISRYSKRAEWESTEHITTDEIMVSYHTPATKISPGSGWRSAVVGKVTVTLLLHYITCYFF
jgi:hypothetical protein